LGAERRLTVPAAHTLCSERAALAHPPTPTRTPRGGVERRAHGQCCPYRVTFPSPCNGFAWPLMRLPVRMASVAVRFQTNAVG